MSDSNAPVDKVVPGDSWEFDENVTKCFDNMLERSIPMYKEMRQLCHELGRNFIDNTSVVIDFGASRGEALRPFIEDDTASEFIAVEVSEPMRNAMREMYGDNPKVMISDLDMRRLDSGAFSDDYIQPDGSTVWKNEEYASLVMSILTIQFTPIEYRQQIIQAIYDMLEPGGAFLFVEKVIGNNAKIDTLFTQEYYGMKQRNGYSYDDIQRKRSSLEGVLVPVTAAWNEDMLKNAGFRGVDCFYRNLNFAGWMAIK